MEPAKGKLGVMCVGLGAVTTTFMTGVLMTRKGLAKPVGSMTQYDKIRVGRGKDKEVTFTTAKSFRLLRSTTSCSVPGTYILPMPTKVQ